MLKITEDVQDILQLGYQLSTEPFYLKLFDLVMDGCMKFTSADAGDLYIENDGVFRHLLSVNKTAGTYVGRGEEVEEGNFIIAGKKDIIKYAAEQKQALNIPDLYAAEDEYNVLAFKKFDKEHDYETKSLLVVPMFKPGDKVQGVLVLINCVSDDGSVIPFPQIYESMVTSICSQMSIALTNLNLIQDLEELLMSFVDCLTNAIEARTDYNANHTRNVAKYCMEMIDELNARHTRDEYEAFYPENDREQLYMAAMLHDIGKMITRREVLNKSTRLGGKVDKLRNKLEKIQLMLRIDCLEGRITENRWFMDDLKLTNFIEELDDLNTKKFLEDIDKRRIDEMASKVYVTEDGEEIPYLSEEEKENLSIQKGTLTAAERAEVQEHVVYTEKLLGEIRFNEKYDRVRLMASNHHEYLDGTGYPKGLTAESLDPLTRILTIVDIFDSLTSNDRPYKGTVSLKKALGILSEMAKEGKLDEELVRILSELMLKRSWSEEERSRLEIDL